MADDKKKAPDKKPEGTPLQEVTYLLAGLFLLSIILGQITLYLNSIGWGNLNTVWNYFLHSYFFPLWHNWKYVAVILSTGSIVLIVYSNKKLKEVVSEEEKVYGSPESENQLVDELTTRNKNEKWERVMDHVRSDNPADWRLAIMEADIILEEALRTRGFPGETIGDMLKSAAPGDLRSLDAAWDAHKVRNKIAHSGSDFDLNEREALRVVNLFETVFKELEVI